MKILPGRQCVIRPSFLPTMTAVHHISDPVSEIILKIKYFLFGIFLIVSNKDFKK